MFGKIAEVVGSALASVQPTKEAIQRELQAYQMDKNPDHLMQVISMQQAIIEHRSMALSISAQIGSVLEGALKGLDPSTPGPKLTPDVLRAIENMTNQVGAGPGPLPLMGTGSVADQLQGQRLMQQEQEVLKMITNLLQQRSDMAKSMIQNMR
jgi:hypothetical protein